jgi:hypothetical protein
MACSDPVPVIQGDGSTFQWSNCTCASGAVGLDADTCGAHRTTGERVRELTGDTSGGTNLNEVDAALLRGWPDRDHLDVRLGIAFTDAIAMVDANQPCLVQGGYNLASIGLSGSPGFHGNHCMFWGDVKIARLPSGAIDYAASEALIWDPLWDGRRPGIPDRRFRWIPLATLRDFCGLLDLSTARASDLLGAGRAYAAFVNTRPVPVAPKPAPIHIDYGRNDMIVAGGMTLASSHVMSLKKGQPLYRSDSPGAPVVTKMARAASVACMGNAANGMRAVLVKTANFADHALRPVVVYVPSAAGKVSAK